ncbi:unnamed protein product, partial [marine sediment metagenome]
KTVPEKVLINDIKIIMTINNIIFILGSIL